MYLYVKDSKVEVRLQAVCALYHLQDPEDVNDPVIQQYLKQMYDPNAKVSNNYIKKAVLIFNLHYDVGTPSRDRENCCYKISNTTHCF